MAWIITRDVLAEQNEGRFGNDTGTYGPAGITEVAYNKLQRGDGHMFLMYDDDDELYYEGLLLGDPTSFQGFSPLDDFGTPNAGCTRIDYYNAETKEWETL
jgi:hypothetical protein